MKTQEEAAALTKFEKEISSVLEKEYKSYNGSVKNTPSDKDEFYQTSKVSLKKEIKERFGVFTKDLGFEFNITEESIAELQAAIKALEEDIKKNGESEEKRTLLTASKDLCAYMLSLDPKLDKLCDDFYSKDKRKNKPRSGRGNDVDGKMAVATAAIIGVFVGGIVCLAATIAVLPVAIGAIGIGGTLLSAMVLYPIIASVGGIIGAALGGMVAERLELKEVKKAQEKVHKEDIDTFAQSITESAKTLKILTDIRQENIKLEGLSVAEPGRNETSTAQLKNSSKSSTKQL